MHKGICSPGGTPPLSYAGEKFISMILRYCLQGPTGIGTGRNYEFAITCCFLRAETEFVKPEIYEGVLSLKLRVVETGIDRVYMTCQDLPSLYLHLAEQATSSGSGDHTIWHM
jgi:hypothetical protein